MHCHVSSSWQRTWYFLLGLFGSALWRDLSCPVTCHPLLSVVGWLSSREQWPAPSLAVHERSGQRLGACYPWRSLPAQ